MSSVPNSRCSILRPRPQERGYVLLVLLLMVSLIIIAAAAVLPTISFELRRDREEEMIHRGVQYSRAIRTYYKKFGRYPARIEDLENTNNMRFLRKRYKDPITGKDFKLLRFGDVKMTLSSPLAGASNISGATGLNGPSPLNATSPGGFGSQSSAFGGATGTSSSASATSDQNQSPDSKQPGQTAGQQSSSSSNSGDQLSNQTFGGMPIVGVVSISKKDGIREFNHKKKYSEWQFIYDPASDRGGLLNTPNQPPLMGFGNQSGPNMGSPNNSPLGPPPGTTLAPTNPNPSSPNPTSPAGPGNPTQPPPDPQ